MINYIFAYIVYRKRIHLAENGDDSRRFYVKILSLKWSLSGHILNVHSVDFYNFT